jgi:hypothetical protein
MIREFDMQLLDKLAKQYYLSSTTKKDKSQIITSYAELCNIRRETSKKRFVRYVNKTDNKNKILELKTIGRPSKYNQIHKDIIKYV